MSSQAKRELRVSDLVLSPEDSMKIAKDQAMSTLRGGNRKIDIAIPEAGVEKIAAIMPSGFPDDVTELAAMAESTKQTTQVDLKSRDSIDHNYWMHVVCPPEDLPSGMEDSDSDTPHTSKQCKTRKKIEPSKKGIVYIPIKIHGHRFENSDKEVLKMKKTPRYAEDFRGDDTLRVLVEWKDYPNRKDYTFEPVKNIEGPLEGQIALRNYMKKLGIEAYYSLMSGNDSSSGEDEDDASPNAERQSTAAGTERRVGEALDPENEAECKLCHRYVRIRLDERKDHVLHRHMTGMSEGPNFEYLLEEKIVSAFPYLISNRYQCQKCPSFKNTSVDERMNHVSKRHCILWKIECPISGCSYKNIIPRQLIEHFSKDHRIIDWISDERTNNLSNTMNKYNRKMEEMHMCIFPMDFSLRDISKRGSHDEKTLNVTQSLAATPFQPMLNRSREKRRHWKSPEEDSNDETSVTTTKKKEMKVDKKAGTWSHPIELSDGEEEKNEQETKEKVSRPMMDRMDNKN